MLSDSLLLEVWRFCSGYPTASWRIPLACAICPECPFEDVNLNESIHEIHISIPKEYEQQFSALADEKGFRVLSVDFINVDGEIDRHVMSAERVRGDQHADLRRSSEIELWTLHDGIPIERVKIESNVRNDMNANADTYFERHVRYELTHDRLDKLISIVDNRAKICFNVKHSDPDRVTPLVTFKSPDFSAHVSTEFINTCLEIEDDLQKQGFVPTKRMTEFVWMDTNPSYDDVWAYA